MNIALIKAGGVGQRMGAKVPKQFIMIQDKPIIIYTLEQFQKNPSVDKIIVVCVDGWHEILESYAEVFGISKLYKIVDGGETSLKSIQNGVNYLENVCLNEDIVIIHDGNRPVITQNIISDVIAQCKIYGSAVAAIPCTDEVMVCDENFWGSNKYLDRKKLYRIQTPDAYRFDILKKLFDNATEEQLVTIGATNTLMINQGGTVHFAQGSELNIRLTTQEDIVQCTALLRAENRLLDDDKFQ